MKCIEKVRARKAKRQAAELVVREKNIWLRGQQAHLDISEAAVSQAENTAPLRDQIMMAVLPAVYAEFWRGYHAGEFSLPEDWHRGIAIDAYAIADAAMEVRGE